MKGNTMQRYKSKPTLPKEMLTADYNPAIRFYLDVQGTAVLQMAAKLIVQLMLQACGVKLTGKPQQALHCMLPG